MDTMIPIPIFINRSSNTEPPKKCPKCGHEYYKPEPEDKGGGSAIGGLLLLVLFGLILAAILLGVDDLAFNNRIYTKMFYKDQCDFIVPDGYHIDTSGKLFVVRKEDSLYGVSYLKINMLYFKITDYHASVCEPSFFYTECRAKAVLKAYLEQEQQHLKGFKPIK